MLETHPYPPFVPPDARYLILGGFPGKPEPGNDWYYGSSRNQFWPIIEGVYQTKLKNKTEKQRLFSRLGMAVMDTIVSCERKRGTNADNQLINITLNTRAVNEIFKSRQIKTVFFSSRFVERLFKKNFLHLTGQNPRIKFICLPSPSPRFAMITLKEKVKSYRLLLPKREM